MNGNNREPSALSLTGELSPGERLLWTGRPRQGVFFLRADDAFVIPFSLVWCGIVFCVGIMMLSHLRDNAPPWPVLLGVLLLMLLGIYLLIGRFLVDARQRAKTVYAVTSARIIIRSGLFKPATDSLSLRALPDILLERHFGGRGTIIFGPTDSEMFYGDFGGIPGFRGRLNPPRFESIEDAARVYEIILAAQGVVPKK